MDYPDDFDVPANPAGKRIAISRIMAIWTSIAFLLIIFLCFILLWSYKSQTLSPILISINNNNGEWSVVGHKPNSNQSPIFKTMQEYVAGNFIKHWFEISKNITENESAWEKCDRDSCRDDTLMFGARTCAIYCAAGSDIYSRFLYDVVPNYKLIQNANNYLTVDMDSIQIMPVEKISKNGGSWRATATILGSDGDFKIQAFIKIALNKVNFPKTMGFYVADFNAYRIDK